MQIEVETEEEAKEGPSIQTARIIKRGGRYCESKGIELFVIGCHANSYSPVYEELVTATPEVNHEFL